MRAILLGAWVLLGSASASEPAPPQGDPEVGEALAGLAGCLACHTSDDGPPGAGGHALVTRFGTFHGPNITPDPEHGLGAWTFEDFHRAMRRGKRPDGKPYYPSFPYTAYTDLTDEDLHHLWAWLQDLAPVARPDTPHELAKGYRGRGLVRLWRGLAFRKGPFRQGRREPDQVARGRYLGDALGHCGECHTPRDGIGRPKTRWALAGSQEPPEPAPNITPHPTDGVGAWAVDELEAFLQWGMLPDGDFVGGEMMRVVEEGTAPLSDADRAALIAWWMTMHPRPSRDREAVDGSR